jgi:hypothetical protein
VPGGTIGKVARHPPASRECQPLLWQAATDKLKKRRAVLVGAGRCLGQVSRSRGHEHVTRHCNDRQLCWLGCANDSCAHVLMGVRTMALHNRLDIRQTVPNGSPLPAGSHRDAARAGLASCFSCTLVDDEREPAFLCAGLLEMRCIEPPRGEPPATNSGVSSRAGRGAVRQGTSLPRAWFHPPRARVTPSSNPVGSAYRTRLCTQGPILLVP